MFDKTAHCYQIAARQASPTYSQSPLYQAPSANNAVTFLAKSAASSGSAWRSVLVKSVVTRMRVEPVTGWLRISLPRAPVAGGHLRPQLQAVVAHRQGVAGREADLLPHIAGDGTADHDVPVVVGGELVGAVALQLLAQLGGDLVAQARLQRLIGERVDLDRLCARGQRR